MKRFGSVLAAAVAALALGACEPRDGANTADTGAAQIQPGTVATPGAAAAGTVEVQLSGVNNSGVSGNARLEHGRDSVRVSLSMNGLQAGTQYRGHLHRGTCGADRGRISSLESFSVSTGTTGETVATIPATSMDPAEREYFIEVHGPNDAVVACGNVPEHAHGTGG